MLKLDTKNEKEIQKQNENIMSDIQEVDVLFYKATTLF